MDTSWETASMDDGGLDRRRFLQLLGIGGVGAAGLAGLSLLGLPEGSVGAAATDAISLGNRIVQLAVADHGSTYTFAEKCQAAQYWAERAVGVAAPRTYSTAKLAYQASTIVSTNPATAPAGSFSYYNASSAGHVVTNIGNGYCINSSPTADGTHYHDFGHGLYISRIADYKVGPYLGWSYKNGTNAQLSMTAWAPPGGGTPTWAWNPPVASVQQRIQAALTRRGRYTGPVNGIWGVNSIKGIQTTCKNVGYTGPVNGIPGANTCHYVQVYAAKFGGYTGPINSVLGPNSWNGFMIGLEKP